MLFFETIECVMIVFIKNIIYNNIFDRIIFPLSKMFFLFIIVQLSAQTYLISDGGTITTCTGTLYDSGGAAGEYAANENETITICADNGECSYIDIQNLDLSDTDRLEVYDGTGTSPAALLSTLQGSLASGQMESVIRGSSGGCLTLRFVSNGNQNAGGFEIELGCDICPLDPTTNEQDCFYAIPVCNGLYFQNNSYLGEGQLEEEISNANTCFADGERNDVWYVFMVQSSGDLSFLITPNNPGDDYDFAVFDITDNGCDGIFSGASPVITCNFSNQNIPGFYYQTGAYSGPPYNGIGDSWGQNDAPFNASTPVITGHIYVLNVSNFNTSQEGYILDLTHSTAVLYDNLDPVATDIETPSACGQNSIIIHLSELVRCSTVQDCDFVITGPGGPYSIETIDGCDNADYTADLSLTIDPPFSTQGNFTISLASLDNNGCGYISDFCGNALQDFNEPFSISNNLLPAQITGSDLSCSGSLEIYTTSGYTTYNWVVSGGNISGASNGEEVNINWSNTATGTITLIAGDGSGCTVSSSMEVVINNPDCNDNCPSTLDIVLGDCLCDNSQIDPAFNAATYCGAGQYYDFASCTCVNQPNNCEDNDCSTDDVLLPDGTCSFPPLPALSYAVTGNDCNAGNTAYNLYLQLSGGIGNGYTLTADPYVVTGSPNTGIYTVYDIPGGTGISISFADGNGCTGSADLAPVSCNCSFIPTPTGAADAQICLGDPMPALSVDAPPAGLDVYWYDAPGSSNIIGFGTSFTPTAPATYYALYADLPCAGEAVAITLTEGPGLAYVITASDCNAGNATYSYTLTVSGGTGTGYSILAAPYNVVNNANDFTIENIPSGQAVDITITDSNGCGLTDALEAVNCNCPDIAEPQSVADIFQCFGDPAPSFSIAAISAGLTAYWIDENNDPVAQGLSYSPSAEGAYGVYVSDGNCNSDTLWAQFTAYEEIAIAGTSTSCTPDLQFYNFQFSISGGSGTGYDIDGLWAVTDHPDGSHTIENIPAGEDLLFTITDDQFCNRDFLIPAPDCNCPDIPEAQNPQGILLCPGLPLSQISVDDPGLSYSIFWEDGMGNQVAATPAFIPDAPGIYYAYMTDGNCLSDPVAVSAAYYEAILLNNINAECAPDDASFDYSFEMSGGSGQGYMVDVPVSMLACSGQNCTLTGLTTGADFTFNIIDDAGCVYPFTALAPACNGCTNLSADLAVPADTICLEEGLFLLDNLLLDSTSPGFFALADAADVPISQLSPAQGYVSTYDLIYTALPPESDPDNCPSVSHPFTLSLSRPATAEIVSSAVLCNNSPGAMVGLDTLLLNGGEGGYWSSHFSTLQITDQILDVSGTEAGNYPLYYVLPQMPGCAQDSLTLSLTIEDCSEKIFYIPSAFSPNGDGRNDRFNYIASPLTSGEMYIYDRWGRKVFSSTQPTYGWDGNINGNEGEIGVYVYLIRITYTDGTEEVKKGNITLIR